MGYDQCRSSERVASAVRAERAGGGGLPDRQPADGEGADWVVDALASVAGKLSFARAIGGNGGLDHRLHEDIAEFGIDAFALEVLDVVKRTPEMTPDQLRRELAALEGLWREEEDASALY
jgi:hypothetical protein